MEDSYHRAKERARSRPAGYKFLAQVPLAAFAIGGMITIALIKVFFAYDPTLAAILAATFAVGSIIVYCILVHWHPSLRLREDQLGDNCYYLGFLYTLASLSMALYQFTMATTADSVSSGVTDIIANFGIALSSTIVGILLRVIINQTRKDALETEADARMMLTESVVHLRVQLDDSVIALRSFCAQTQQTASDAIRDSALKANGALEESVARIATTSNSVLDRIEEAFGAFNENTQKLNKVAAGTVSALEKLVKRLENMEAPSDLITKRLEAIMATAGKAGDMLRERLESDEKAILAAARRIAETEETLHASVRAIGGTGSGLDTIAEATAAAGKAAEEAARKLSDLTAVMARNMDEQERMVGEIGKGSQHLTVTLVEEQRRLAREARESMDGLIESLKAHNTGMATELDRTRRMAADTGTAMAEMADLLTDGVKSLRVQRPYSEAAK